MSKNQKRPRGPKSYSFRNQLLAQQGSGGRKAKRKFCGTNLLTILQHILGRRQGG